MAYAIELQRKAQECCLVDKELFKYFPPLYNPNIVPKQAKTNSSL